MTIFMFQARQSVPIKHLYIENGGDHNYYGYLCLGEGDSAINNILQSGYLIPAALAIKSILETPGGCGFYAARDIISNLVTCKVCSTPTQDFVCCDITTKSICIRCSNMSFCYDTNNYMLPEYISICNCCSKRTSVGKYSAQSPHFFTCNYCLTRKKAKNV